MSKKNKLVDFRAVREAVSMEQILSHYGLLAAMKRSGDNLSGCCPIHKGTNPTQFRVSVSKSVWNCFSECKRGGNAVDFIARMEDVSPYAAAQKAIAWFKLDLDRVYTDGDRGAEKPKEVRDSNKESPPKAKPASPVEPVVEAKPEGDASNPPLRFRLDKLQRDHPYLIERGLMLETLVDFGAGYCEKGMMAGRIAIPIHSVDGQVVAYAGRHVGDPPDGVPKYKLPPGFRKSSELFNLDRARHEPGPLIVVEGFFDAMTLHQLGHRKVVALMGSSLSPAQEALIHQHIDPQGLILVMLDEDEAGRTARGEIAARLARFAFARIHTFDQERQQPEHLTAEQVSALFA